MKAIILSNGNYAKVNSKRYVYNKCIFSFTIYQKDRFWFESITESFSNGYYDSVENFIKTNY